MADMICSNYVAETSIDGSTVGGVIEYNWSKGQEPVPSEMQRGRFLPSPLYTIPPETL